MENFLPAADQLTEQGYFVLRMGQWSKNTLDHNNPRVIDYATKFQTDFMDAYLSAKCAFFIGTNSGMTSIPMMYRTPLAVVNVVPYSEISYSGVNDLFILKKYFSTTQDRLLTLSEILSEPLLLHYNKYTDSSRAYYEGIGLEIHENSPEEISGLIQEIEQRERGEFQPSQEDQELQDRYISILEENNELIAPFSDFQRLRMGSHFLRTNSVVLE
jgi:putative glycosyltransferase (TIGR04372 family)